LRSSPQDSSHVTVTSESESCSEEEDESHHSRLHIPINGISVPSTSTFSFR